MTRITENMTYAQIEALPGLGHVRGHLMECAPDAAAYNGLISPRVMRSLQGDAIADRMLSGLRRLDEVAQALDDPCVPLWSEEEVGEVPARGRTRLFRFPGRPGAPFVLVCAGGGYSVVCNALEGFPLAAELNAAGYHAFVLTYRTRADARMPAPIEDLARAVQQVLAHADELGVAPRYALAGFSAGAHLVGELCTDNHGWETHGLPRPEALVLNYPATDTEVLAGLLDARANDTVREMLEAMYGSPTCDPWPSPADLTAYNVTRHISPQCPPVYLWTTEDDVLVTPGATHNLAARLSELGVTYSLRSYPQGDHGLTAPHDPDADRWPGRVISFLQEYL